jgi:hypothetical protein
MSGVSGFRWRGRTATELVGNLLGVGFAGVGLGAASDLVSAAGEGLFGLVEGGFGGVGGLDGGLVKYSKSGKVRKEAYHLLARLGVEVFAESFGHCGGGRLGWLVGWVGWLGWLGWLVGLVGWVGWLGWLVGWFGWVVM